MLNVPVKGEVFVQDTTDADRLMTPWPGQNILVIQEIEGRTRRLCLAGLRVQLCMQGRMYGRDACREAGRACTAMAACARPTMDVLNLATPRVANHAQQTAVLDFCGGANACTAWGRLLRQAPRVYTRGDPSQEFTIFGRCSRSFGRQSMAHSWRGRDSRAVQTHTGEMGHSARKAAVLLTAVRCRPRCGPPCAAGARRPPACPGCAAAPRSPLPATPAARR